MFTVPGQVEYNASRKLILNGVDAIVFVSDSDPARRIDNFESLENMALNLADFELSLDKMPWVMQHNKRDLSTAMTLEQMELDMNTLGVPSFESIATEGLGVFATLRAVSKLLMEELATFVA